ncbi:MAG: zinc ribbon domain-containing protein [Methanoregula sp.]
MSDPELRSDETVLVRTQGVYVKSIPFEGIITNKRILLVDRTKNLLPLKEIPLVTIKDIDGGENAIRDPVVTVTVITRTGETRQMVLTFARTAGGNRNKERDEWVKTLKENVSSSFEQVINKGTPATDQVRRGTRPDPSPRINVTGTTRPAAARPLPEKETDMIHPVKRIIENAPSRAPVPAREPAPQASGFGVFCTRCGNKVPEGSGFCNRCGSAIIQPGSTIPAAPAPQPAVPDYRAPVQRPAERESQPAGPPPGRPPVKAPVDYQISIPPEPPIQKTAPSAYSPLYDNPPEPVATPPRPAPAITQPPQKRAKKGLIPRLFSPKELSQTPLNPASMPGAAPPPKKPRSPMRMPGKKVFIALGIVILLVIIAVVGVVVYPMISSGSIGSGNETSQSGAPVTVTPTLSTSSTPATSGTIVISETTPAPAAPVTGVYVHVDYIGGWKGTYGMSSDLQKADLSGDRFLEVVNATGPIQANFEKLDGSTKHPLVVEIYKNGGLLKNGTSSAAYGKVTISADVK